MRILRVSATAILSLCIVFFQLFAEAKDILPKDRLKKFDATIKIGSKVGDWGKKIPVDVVKELLLERLSGNEGSVPNRWNLTPGQVEEILFSAVEQDLVGRMHEYESSASQFREVIRQYTSYEGAMKKFEQLNREAGIHLKFFGFIDSYLLHLFVISRLEQLGYDNMRTLLMEKSLRILNLTAQDLKSSKTPRSQIKIVATNLSVAIAMGLVIENQTLRFVREMTPTWELKPYLVNIANEHKKKVKDLSWMVAKSSGRYAFFYGTLTSVAIAGAQLSPYLLFKLSTALGLSHQTATLLINNGALITTGLIAVTGVVWAGFRAKRFKELLGLQNHLQPAIIKEMAQQQRGGTLFCRALTRL